MSGRRIPAVPRSRRDGLFETDGERWRYGTLRLSSAGLNITLDGQQAVTYEAFNPRGRSDGPYHNAAHKIVISK